MADAVGNKIAKDYHLDVAPVMGGFHVKGMAHAGWGMKSRLSKVFNPQSGNTVMLAFDHGYIMGPTAGLERLDIVIDPLIPYVDALMGTRGAFRTCIRPDHNKAVCLRATRDTTVLFDDLAAGNGFATDIDDAIRLNADLLAIQCFVGAQSGEATSLETLCRAADMGEKYNIPVMGVTAVGKEMARTDKYFMLATRVLAENGAHAIKTYYCDGFEKVVAQCPVPIVVAGGKKLPELEALDMAYKSMMCGAKGMDMGRNIFQAEDPVAMCAAVAKVVHEYTKPEIAFEFYNDTKK